MRSLAALCILLFSPSVIWAAEAQPSPFDTPSGTYKTVQVTSLDECREICIKEGSMCQGSIGVQPDISKPEITCHLNDGLDPESDYWQAAPPPVDLQKTLSDLNNYRQRFGLSPVKLNQKLNAASQMHSDDMAQMADISHTGSNGSASGDRAQMKGYYFTLLAENVAGGQTNWDKVFKAWQESPSHNENLLLPDVTEFGIALTFNRQSSYKYYWAMLVGTPMLSAP